MSVDSSCSLLLAWKGLNVFERVQTSDRLNLKLLHTSSQLNIMWKMCVHEFCTGTVKSKTKLFAYLFYFLFMFSNDPCTMWVWPSGRIIVLLFVYRDRKSLLYPRDSLLFLFSSPTPVIPSMRCGPDGVRMRKGFRLAKEIIISDVHPEITEIKDASDLRIIVFSSASKKSSDSYLYIHGYAANMSCYFQITWTFWPDDGARWKVKSSPKLLEFILEGSWMSEPNFMTINPTDVETFHAKPQMWTSWWRWRRSQ